jgi:hypothetical protein
MVTQALRHSSPSTLARTLRVSLVAPGGAGAPMSRRVEVAMNRRRSLLAALAVALALPMSNCTYYDEPPAVGVGAYVPDYYEGNVVYFDNDQPYYFNGDEVRYVPRDLPEYRRFRAHHHREPEAYRAWYEAHPPPHLLTGPKNERRDEQQWQWHYRRNNRDPTEKIRY